MPSLRMVLFAELRNLDGLSEREIVIRTHGGGCSGVPAPPLIRQLVVLTDCHPRQTACYHGDRMWSIFPASTLAMPTTTRLVCIEQLPRLTESCARLR